MRRLISAARRCAVTLIAVAGAAALSAQSPAPTAPSFPLRVTPMSVTGIDVVVVGRFADPKRYRGVAEPHDQLGPLLPAPISAETSDAIELLVRAPDGTTASTGTPVGVDWWDVVPVVHFKLNRELAPRFEPYVVAARWRKSFAVAATSTLLVTDLSGSVRLQHEPAALNLAYGFNPLVNDAETAALSRRYLGVPVLPDHFDFTCLGASEIFARGRLHPGHTVKLDVIARSPHLMWTVADDPRDYSHRSCIGKCHAKGATFTDSPLVISFPVDPADVDILPPMYVSGHVRPRAPGNDHCARGVAILQDGRQLAEIFRSAP